MSTDPIYLLPPLTPNCAPLEPVIHLLEALDYIAKMPCGAAKDADERRELLYLTAAANLANTHPELEQNAVYDRHVARYLQLNATQQRIATLAMHGLATDRASRARPWDGRTWAAAAIAAIETYRNRATSRISNRLAKSLKSSNVTLHS